jgi:hypothetical protein
VHKALPALTTVAVFAAVATSAAVVPPSGVTLKGTTSSPVINGFKDPVRFKVKGHKVKSFKWGVLGCFGAGGFIPGKNPYTGKGSSAKLGSLSISSKGKISGGGTFTLSQVKTKAKVTGKFGTKKVRGKRKYTAKGKITIRQTFRTQKCGPQVTTFSASS